MVKFPDKKWWRTCDSWLFVAISAASKDCFFASFACDCHSMLYEKNPLCVRCLHLRMGLAINKSLGVSSDRGCYFSRSPCRMACKLVTVVTKNGGVGE